MDNFEEYKSKELIRQLNENPNLNEGLFGAIVGGLTGSKIADALCKALGVTNGPLYTLFHSKAFTTLLGGYLGYKL